MSSVEYFLTKARHIPSPSESFQQLSSDLSILPVEVALQDMYGDFNLPANKSLLKSFEEHVSQLFQKESGLFVISGVMAQSIALSIHTQNRNKLFLCHYSSHLLIAENNSYKELLQLNALIVPSKENSLVQFPLSASEVIQTASNSDVLPSVIILECPHRELGGKITPWEDLVQISEFCRQKDIKFHLDGARIWEATVAYQKSLAEICSLFDSVYVSFYKGLGGMTGAMLLGSSSFIAESRVWLRRFGGNIFTSLPFVVSSFAGLINNVNAFQERTERLQHVVKILTDLFQTNSPPQLQLIRFDPEVPQVSLIHVYLRGAPSSTLLQIRDRVFSETSISCFTMLRSCDQKKSVDFEVIQQSYFEFNMGPHNIQISDEIWLQGWELFLRYLQEHIAATNTSSEN